MNGGTIGGAALSMDGTGPFMDGAIPQIGQNITNASRVACLLREGLNYAIA